MTDATAPLPAEDVAAEPTLSRWTAEFTDPALEAQYRRFKLPQLRRMGYAVTALVLLATAGYLPLDLQLPDGVRAVVLPLRLSMLGIAGGTLLLLVRGGGVPFCEGVLAAGMGSFYAISSVLLVIYPFSELYIVARSVLFVALGTIVWPGSARIGWPLNAAFTVASTALILIPRSGAHDQTVASPTIAALVLLLVFAGGTVFCVSQQRSARQDYLRFLRERRLRAELDQKRREAEAATRAKSEFLAAMSHEIRTPMTGILGTLRLALDKPMTPDLRDDLTAVHHAAGDLMVILNAILDFSKLEAGKADCERAPFDLPQLVGDTVTLMEGEALAKGLRVGVEVDPAVPRTVTGDPGKLRQVLLNLIGNAVKFTEAGGVTVRVAPLPRDALERGGVEISITDTGIGIDEAGRAKLFQAFSQVDASIARRFGGTGLGLAISRRLVEAMGGDIGFESAPGRGSRFWVRLRLEAAAPAETPVAPERPPLPPLCILLAEDSPLNQKVVTGLLKAAGHTVAAVAANGAEAVEIATAGGFDLILMDMRMPVMDGLTATRAVRALPGPAGRVPIVALTANALRADGEACRAAGMDGHVAKPIDPETLFRTIAAALDRGGR